MRRYRTLPFVTAHAKSEERTHGGLGKVRGRVVIRVSGQPRGLESVVFSNCIRIMTHQASRGKTGVQPSMSQTLNWGILATGTIAKTFARGVQGSRTGRLVAVGSRSVESANKFGDELQVPRRYGTYDELLTDPE